MKAGNNPRNAGRKPLPADEKKSTMIFSLSQELIAAIKTDNRTNSSIAEQAIRTFLHL